MSFAEIVYADRTYDTHRNESPRMLSVKHSRSKLPPYLTDQDDDDYSVALRRITTKIKPRDERNLLPRPSIYIELGLEGIPIISLVLLICGFIWLVFVIRHKDVFSLFPSIYMTLGFGGAFLVSHNIKRRFRKRHLKRRVNPLYARATQ
jgi:hypothetical protein